MIVVNQCNATTVTGKFISLGVTIQ